MKDIIKNNKVYLAVILFTLSFLVSFIILFYENVYRIDYWKSVSPTEDLITKQCHSAAVNSSNKYIETFATLKESFQTLTLSNNDTKCFHESGITKVGINIVEVMVLLAYSFSIFILLQRAGRKFLLHVGRNKSHVIIVGLTAESKVLAQKLLDEDEKVVFIEQDKNNIYIEELEHLGAIVVIGDATNKIFLDDAKLLNAKDMYLMCKDSTNLEVATVLKNLLVLEESNKENLYYKDRQYPLNIYVHLISRSNRHLFDVNGVFNLNYDELTFHPFSMYNIIAKNIFVKRPLYLTINDPWDENDIQRYLIVEHNEISKEILYQLLKIGHFVNGKPIEVTIVDKDFERLNMKYKNWIEIGKNPYNAKEGDEKPIWNLSFVGEEILYESTKEESELFENDEFKFNRMILCNKKPGQSLEVLSKLNNKYNTKIKEKKTIIQVYNPNINFGEMIVKNSDKMEHFFTFGELSNVCDPQKIKNDDLLNIAKLTNNYKEIIIGGNISKAWENISLFTRESNITEKEHMDIKLHAMGLSSKSLDNDLVKSNNLIIDNEEKVEEKLNKIKNVIEKYNIKEDVFKKKINNIESCLGEINVKKHTVFKSLKELFEFELKPNDETTKLTPKENDEIKEIKSEIIKIYNLLFPFELSTPKTDKDIKKENWKKLKELPYLDDIITEKKLDEALKKDDKKSEILLLVESSEKMLDLSKINKVLYHELAKIEHTRWNAYHLLNGWSRKTDKFNKNNKNEENKEHFDICDWETLQLEDPGVLKYDYKNIYQIPYILKLLGKELVLNYNIGITGIRDLNGINVENLKIKIKSHLENILNKQSMNVTLFTPLADGVDRMVAQIVLEEFENMKIKVPLPMDEDIYKTTFVKGLFKFATSSKEEGDDMIKNSIREFDHLISKIKKRNKSDDVIIPIKFDREKYLRSSDEEKRTIRHEQYSKVGEYVAINSDVLIGAYKKDSEEKPGGTKEIIRKKETKEYEYFIPTVFTTNEVEPIEI